MREESAWLPVSVRVLLHEYPSSGILGRISGNGKWCIRVRHLQYWLHAKDFLQDVKSCLTLGGPFPDGTLLGKVNKWPGESRVIRDEPSIKVGKTKEGAHILDPCWYRPLFNAFDLDRVHGNGILSDDHP